MCVYVNVFAHYVIQYVTPDACKLEYTLLYLHGPFGSHFVGKIPDSPRPSRPHPGSNHACPRAYVSAP